MKPNDSSRYQSVRSLYASQMLALAEVSGNHRLENAFADVPREAFLGNSEWQILESVSGYTPLPSNDPALIYRDVVIGLATHRGVNNGSPSLHAAWMNAMAPELGDTVTHIDAGTGYYTAILAQLVGQSGKVTAIEYDEELAQQLTRNLADLSNVDVICADGAVHPKEQVDGIYVNFATARPADTWIENLMLGGRLVFPLGIPENHASLPGTHAFQAIGLMIRRLDDGYQATSLSSASFVFAEGLLDRNQQEMKRLRESLKNGGDHRIRSLIWEGSTKSSAWFSGDDWGLSFDEVSQGV